MIWGYFGGGDEGEEKGLILIYWQEKDITLLQITIRKAKHENVCF